VCGEASTPTLILLDAAKGAALDPPDLGDASDAFRPHFVSMSYYKLFGYPTGFGCLLVRTEALPILLAGRRGWGGGAALSQSAVSDAFTRRAGVAGLEEGTQSFAAAAALPPGFDALQTLPGGLRAADAHARRISADLVRNLRSLRHACGAPVATVYGWGSPLASSLLRGQGPTVAFNLLSPTGTLLPCAAVEQALALRGIAIRSGAMCNPGACGAALGELGGQGGLEGGCGEGVVEAAEAGGVLRASFGYCSLVEDAEALLSALREFFCVSALPSCDVVSPPAEGRYGLVRVAAVALYPLKGGAPFVVAPGTSWPLSPATGGLLHDRCWAAVDEGGAALTQCRCARLALLRPSLDLEAGTLTLSLCEDGGESLPPLTLPLHSDGGNGAERARVCGRGRACGAANASDAASRTADAWLSAALHRPCTLLRACSDTARSASFANERRGLSVVCRASCASLRRSVAARSGAAAAALLCESAFRANVVLEAADGGQEAAAFDEDRWSWLREEGAGRLALRVLAPCARCSQVTLCPRTGQRRPGPPEPLLTLSAERMQEGRPRFGVLAEAEGRGELRCGILLQPGSGD
jgi:molybdenum cofactor sulfurtransferase